VRCVHCACLPAVAVPPPRAATRACSAQTYALYNVTRTTAAATRVARALAAPQRRRCLRAYCAPCARYFVACVAACCLIARRASQHFNIPDIPACATFCWRAGAANKRYACVDYDMLRVTAYRYNHRSASSRRSHLAYVTAAASPAFIAFASPQRLSPLLNLFCSL